MTDQQNCSAESVEAKIRHALKLARDYLVEEGETDSIWSSRENALAVRAIDAAENALGALTPAAAQPSLEKALRELLDHVDRNTCTHEQTSRGGAIWTICDDCGMKWADDRGGFKPHNDAPAVTKARAALAAQPPAAPVDTKHLQCERCGEVAIATGTLCDDCAEMSIPHECCSADNVDASAVLTEIIDYFAASNEGAGGEWAHPDDFSSYCLDFQGEDGTKFWLDLEKDGTIHLMWKRGEAMKSMNFGLMPAVPQTSGVWQPIETAPKDGKRILLYQEGRGAFEGWWHTDWPHAEAYWMDDADSEPEPTHWQPTLALPRPERS